MGDTAPPDSKELLRELTVLAQSCCKGREITESAVDWHNAQPEVSLVLGVLSLAGRLKQRCTLVAAHTQASPGSDCTHTDGMCALLQRVLAGHLDWCTGWWS